jgi:hypothetical protein
MLSQLWSEIVKLRFAFAGVLLILLGQSFSYEWLKVSVDGLVANIGSLLLFIGIWQFIYDEKSRRELCCEIVRAVKGSDDLQKNGLVSCLLNSKQVFENEEWRKAEVLVVGYQYSPRFLKDNLELVSQRISKKKKTVICYAGDQKEVLDYLRWSTPGATDIQRSIGEMKDLARQHFDDSPYLLLKEHKRVLKYSFIYTEIGIWIKFYTNSGLRADVPAFKITSRTALFSFFESDIKKLGVLS